MSNGCCPNLHLAAYFFVIDLKYEVPGIVTTRVVHLTEANASKLFGGAAMPSTHFFFFNCFKHVLVFKSG